MPLQQRSARSKAGSACWLAGFAPLEPPPGLPVAEHAAAEAPAAMASRQTARAAARRGIVMAVGAARAE